MQPLPGRPFEALHASGEASQRLGAGSSNVASLLNRDKRDRKQISPRVEPSLEKSHRAAGFDQLIVGLGVQGIVRRIGGGELVHLFSLMLQLGLDELNR